MELVLYNSMLSGMSLDGRRFFYTNVHRRFGDELPLIRNESPLRWENTLEPKAAQSFCCPPNLLRTMLKASEWAYSVSAGALWINLYGSGTLDTGLPDGARVKLTQKTGYPWSGQIRVEIREAPKAEFALMLRIPGWAEKAGIEINGKPWNGAARPGTYAEVRRAWSAGDQVVLDLPMAPRLVESNPYDEYTRGQVAVMRGPLVYCLESPDVPPGVRVDGVRIPAAVQFRAREGVAPLAGVTLLEGEATYRPPGEWKGILYRSFQPRERQKVAIRLIPYYAWANRGLSHMTVWMPLGD
jgi:DUF1680 family protein